MGNRRVWTGRWKGGRTFNGKDGRPVYVLRKMVQGLHPIPVIDRFGLPTRATRPERCGNV